LSRPPDLDWPLDSGRTDRPAVPIEWDTPRGPAPEPAGRHLVFDPDTGSQVFVRDEPAVTGAAQVAHERDAPGEEAGHHEAPGGHDQAAAYDVHTDHEEPAYVDEHEQRAGHEQADEAAHPGYAPHPGYGAGDAELGYGGGSEPDPGYAEAADHDAVSGYPVPRAAGRADAARPGRRGLGGRLASISLPSGRPSLPAGLGGIGDRLSGLRGSRAGAAAGDGAASRASSLRRSLGPSTARRSIVSDPRSRQRSRFPSRPRGRVGAIVALIGVVFVLWFLFSLFQPLKGSGHGQVEVVIPAGAGTSAIGSLLAKDHVISSSFFFKLRVELSGKRGKLESGRYVLKQGMSYGAALAALTGTGAQPAVTIKVTIPEGFSRVQIAAVAKRAGVVGDYVAASAHSHVLKPTSYGAPASVHSLEGFLFPDTYDLLPGDPVSKLINEQLVAFKQQLATVDLSAAKHVNLTPYDVIKIASMVERETSSPRERPLIAAVIYNRLEANMTLGIDATLRYALNDYDKPLTDSQLASKSPYNTRLHRGLPPTPIGNPGLASLEAAAHPAKVSYLYYVVKPGTCSDVFSTTFAQFEHDSAIYNAARAADNGRSPTTCSG
jgi:UPF0755 protein